MSEPTTLDQALVLRVQDCCRLLEVCDRAILLSPADRATVEEIRASLKLRKPVTSTSIP